MSTVENDSAPTLDPAPRYPRLELANLFNIAEWQHEVPWQPFKDGLEIYRIYGDGMTGPTAALIRFNKAGKVPIHAHPGFEHILVLAGAQRDQNSSAAPGTLIINPPGSTHSVVSEAGCIVLAIYEKPVEFLE
jgi:anti-sigma factor ChrR (cupin superfamily)